VKNEFLCHHFLYILTTLSIGEGKIVRRDKTIFEKFRACSISHTCCVSFQCAKIVSMATCYSMKSANVSYTRFDALKIFWGELIFF
jgi:hypothetical protein